MKSEEIVEELSRGDVLAYTLQDKIISGKLDLRHRNIEVAVEIRGCEFLDDVDFRYCEFAQAVDFSGCTFRGDFNSGDEKHSHTVFRSDLTCRRVVFEGVASFNGCRIEGSAYFSEASFTNREKPANFGWLNVEQTFECDGVTFSGSADFNSLQCGGTGFFTGAKFDGQGPVTFRNASFGQNLTCQATIFGGLVDFELFKCSGVGGFDNAVFKSIEGVSFAQASFGSNFQCNNVLFEGPADFNSLRCGRAGSLAHAEFKEAVDLTYASFGDSFDCTGVSFAKAAKFSFLKCLSFGCRDATFEGHASFHGLRCVTVGSFDKSKLGGVEGADFSHASFGRSLSCKGTVFSGSINFSLVECGGSAFFHDAEFLPEGEVTFLRASFQDNLECQQVKFGGESSFNSLRCDGIGLFADARFDGNTNFGHACFDGGLTCERASFSQTSDFNRVKCANLDLREAVFKGAASFNAMKCDGSGFCNQATFGSDLDLQFATFDTPLFFGQATFRGMVNCSRLNCDALECNGAKFEGPVNFDSLNVRSDGAFRGTRFLGETSFSHASFGVNVTYDEAVFRARSHFDSLSCGRSGFFKDTQFAATDLTHASFGLNLSCNRGCSSGPGEPKRMVKVVALAGRRVDAPDAEQSRFPLANVEAVAERLRTALTDLNPEILVSSAACGADLLALDVARTLGIRRRIVLPFDASRFRASSVVDRPGEWGSLFDSLYEEARSSGDVVILLREGDDEDAYAAATDQIISEAMTLTKEEANQQGAGSPNVEPTAVVVWEGSSRGEGDLTAKFVALAVESGMRVVEVNTLGEPEPDEV